MAQASARLLTIIEFVTWISGRTIAWPAHIDSVRSSLIARIRQKYLNVDGKRSTAINWKEKQRDIYSLICSNHRRNQQRYHEVILHGPCIARPQIYVRRCRQVCFMPLLWECEPAIGKLHVQGACPNIFVERNSMQSPQSTCWLWVSCPSRNAQTDPKSIEVV